MNNQRNDEPQKANLQKKFSMKCLQKEGFTHQGSEWPTVFMISCKIHVCLQCRYSKQAEYNELS